MRALVVSSDLTPSCISTTQLSYVGGLLLLELAGQCIAGVMCGGRMLENGPPKQRRPYVHPYVDASPEPINQ